MINLSLKYGAAEFIFYIENTVTGESAGGPFGSFYRMIDPNLVIKLPTFGNYDELKVILQIGFKIVEDLKSEIIK